MPRINHTLSVSKNIYTPSKVLFFDTETSSIQINDKREQLIFKIGYYIYVDFSPNGDYEILGEKSFTDLDIFWSDIDEIIYSNSELLVVAHNITFDMMITSAFYRLQQLNLNLENIFSSGTTNIIVYNRNDTKVKFIDNTNLFQGKLSTWGDTIGLPKLDIDFNLADEKELREYNRRDVLIMVELWSKWLRFLSDNRLGSFRLTTASTAFNSYLFAFNKTKIRIHTEDEVLKLERESYVGGRTECFYIGSIKDQPVYKLDVNSMYPSVMVDNYYPHKFEKYYEDVKVDFLKHKIETHCITADCLIEIDKPAIPTYKEDRRIYPVGVFNAVLSTPELNYILKYGRIIKVNRIAIYRRDILFKEYVEFFNALKVRYGKEGNKPFRNLSKLMLNTLYGKFGQREYISEEIGEYFGSDINVEYGYNSETDQRYKIVRIGGKVLRLTHSGEAFNSFPAIAAHVTAYARIKLWEFMEKAGDKNCYYCDTDSLFVNQQGYNNLVDILDDFRLGALALEASSEHLTVNAPKDYVFGDKVTLKGIRKDAVKLNENTYSQIKWTKLGGAIKTGDLSKVYLDQIIKTLHRKIHSGVLSPNGWIMPYHLQ